MYKEKKSKGLIKMVSFSIWVTAVSCCSWPLVVSGEQIEYETSINLNEFEKNIRGSSENSYRDAEQRHRQLWSWTNMLFTTRICDIPAKCPVEKGPLMCGCPRCEYYHGPSTTKLGQYCANLEYSTSDGSSSSGSSGSGSSSSSSSNQSYDSGNGGDDGGNGGGNGNGNGNNGGGGDVNNNNDVRSGGGSSGNGSEDMSGGESASRTAGQSTASSFISKLMFALGIMGIVALIAAAYMVYKKMIGKKHILSGAVAKKIMDDDASSHNDGNSTLSGSDDHSSVKTSTKSKTSFIPMGRRSKPSMDSKVVEYPESVEVEGPMSAPSSIMTTKFVEMTDGNAKSGEDYQAEQTTKKTKGRQPKFAFLKK